MFAAVRRPVLVAYVLLTIGVLLEISIEVYTQPYFDRGEGNDVRGVIVFMVLSQALMVASFVAGIVGVVRRPRNALAWTVLAVTALFVLWFVGYPWFGWLLFR